MRFIFLLIAFFLISCNMQCGVDKNYIISQVQEKEASEIEDSTDFKP